MRFLLRQHGCAKVYRNLNRVSKFLCDRSDFPER